MRIHWRVRYKHGDVFYCRWNGVFREITVMGDKYVSEGIEYTYEELRDNGVQNQDKKSMIYNFYDIVKNVPEYHEGWYKEHPTYGEVADKMPFIIEFYGVDYFFDYDKKETRFGTIMSCERDFINICQDLYGGDFRAILKDIGVDPERRVY